MIRHFVSVKGTSQKREESPFLALQQLVNKTETQVDQRLYAVLREMGTKWLGLEKLQKAKGDELPFKINNSIVINPKTGKALTRGDWKIIEAEVRKMISWVFADSEVAIVKQAIALGKIASTLPLLTDYSKIDFGKVDIEAAYLKNSIAFAEENAANYITGVGDTLRKDIKAAIIEAQKGKWGVRALEDELYDKFATRNRDFRMIAETEINSNAANAHLLTLLDQAQGKPVFVKGHSSPYACPFCLKEINQQVFAVVAEAPAETDKVTLGGHLYTAVWAGKSNYGRVRATWWACIPGHPHCMCWYLPYNATPKFDKYREQLKTKLASIGKQGLYSKL